jgi:hypothetical protein
LPAIIEDLGGHTARFAEAFPSAIMRARRSTRFAQKETTLRQSAGPRLWMTNDTACMTRNNFWPRTLLLTSIAVTRSCGARFSPPTKAAAAGSGALACTSTANLPLDAPWF